MATLRTHLVVAGQTIAFACLAAMAVDDLTAASRRVRRRLGRLVRPESVRVALAQRGAADLQRLAVERERGGAVTHLSVQPRQVVQAGGVLGVGLAQVGAEDLGGPLVQRQGGRVVAHD